ncbi:MAG: hypothetical protein N2C12_12300, partial [Planctomycetales bacterium]
MIVEVDRDVAIAHQARLLEPLQEESAFTDLTQTFHHLDSSRYDGPQLEELQSEDPGTERHDEELHPEGASFSSETGETVLDDEPSGTDSATDSDISLDTSRLDFDSLLQELDELSATVSDRAAELADKSSATTSDLFDTDLHFTADTNVLEEIASTGEPIESYSDPGNLEDFMPPGDEMISGRDVNELQSDSTPAQEGSDEAAKIAHIDFSTTSDTDSSS